MCGRSRLFVLAAWIALAPTAFAEEAPKHAVHLEIHDGLTGSGLAVSIHRDAESGSKALDFMEDVVGMEYRRYPGVGVFVTSLCGVEAPDGAFWALSVDGERVTKGISDLHIKKPVSIRWDLVELEEE